MLPQSLTEGSFNQDQPVQGSQSENRHVTQTNSEERFPVSEDGADKIQSVSASESTMVVGLAETPSDGITGGLVHVVVYPDLPREGSSPVTWFQRSQVFFLATRHRSQASDRTSSWIAAFAHAA